MININSSVADNCEKYFLCSNTSKGFVTYYDELRTNAAAPGKSNIYYIKGGPGTGKSSFMRKIESGLSQQGMKTDSVLCSSDVSSLDAVICNDLSFAVADATAPHTIDPKYPGCCENILNFGEFWDKTKLIPNKDEIINISDLISSEYKKIYRYLNAAGNIHSDNIACALPACDFDKIRSAAGKYAKKHIKYKNKKSRASHRFLSAVSYAGFYNTFESIYNNYKHINVIEDKYGVSYLFLKYIAEFALKSGNDVVICYNPILPDNIEHILIPELSLCYITSNKYHSFTYPYERRIHMTRFIDCNLLKNKRANINFNNKAKDELYSYVINIMKKIKALHDKLESFYINSVDFSKIDDLCADIINKI